MKVIECEQGTPEWWAAKCGLPSASNFNRIFKAASRGFSSAAHAYIDELVEERRQQLPKYFTSQGRPVTPAMQAALAKMDRGLDLEPVARKWYEAQIGRRIYEVGFCTTDDGRFGCSPDALVGVEGGVEIKIYEDGLHAKWCQAGLLPNQFAAQVHGSLLVTGRAWWDLVLYSETQESKVIRTWPDETTRELRVRLEQFHTLYLAAIQKAEDYKYEARDLEELDASDR